MTYSRDVQILWFVRFLVHGEVNCPTIQQWDSRALIKCLDPSLYHCLLDDEDNHTEACVESVYIPKGRYPRLSRNAMIFSRVCPIDEYQPFGKLSNRYRRITCDFKKSTCNDAGEISCDDVSAISDRLCECDYRSGYRNFLSNKCYRKSTTSTHCIYLPCESGKELNPDFQCVDACANGFFRPFKGYICIPNQAYTKLCVFVSFTTSIFRMNQYIKKSITTSAERTLRIGELIDDPEPMIQTTQRASATSDEANLIANVNVASTRLLPKLSPSSQSAISRNGCNNIGSDEIKLREHQAGLSFDSTDAVIARIKDAAIVVLLVLLISVSIISLKQRFKHRKKIKERSSVYLSMEGNQGYQPQKEAETCLYQKVNARENDSNSLGSRYSTERPPEYTCVHPVDMEMETKDSEYVQMNRILSDLNKVELF
ncbi:uncharacterized protein LOC134257245 [Saccostrea cucullata]|uniref:uncharacterized protein LOC134257245 n=1 Tax=Saccostrea cuccullata TaxID=36930 RepID=UPI002ED17CBC